MKSKEAITRYIDALEIGEEIFIDGLVSYVREFAKIKRKTILRHLRELKKSGEVNYMLLPPHAYFKMGRNKKLNKKELTKIDKML